MPSQHSPKNHMITIKFPEELYRKIELKAAERKMNPSQYIRWVLSEHLVDVVLSVEDLKIVFERIRRRMKK